MQTHSNSSEEYIYFNHEFLHIQGKIFPYSTRFALSNGEIQLEIFKFEGEIRPFENGCVIYT